MAARERLILDLYAKGRRLLGAPRLQLALLLVWVRVQLLFLVLLLVGRVLKLLGIDVPPPPKEGEEAGEEPPSASRSVGMLCREFFIDTVLHEPPPYAPGLKGAWALHQQRTGKA